MKATKSLVKDFGIDTFVISARYFSPEFDPGNLLPEQVGFRKRRSMTPKHYTGHILKRVVNPNNPNFADHYLREWHYYNGVNRRCKRLIFSYRNIHYYPVNYDCRFQLVSYQGDRFHEKEIQLILEKLSKFLVFDIYSLHHVEFYWDLFFFPKVRRHSIAISQFRSHTSFPPKEKWMEEKNRYRYTEGTCNKTYGGKTKFYLKNEAYRCVRIENTLYRRRLIERYQCQSIEDVLGLSSWDVLKKESRFIVVRNRDWRKILPDLHRRKSLRKIFVSHGQNALRKEMTVQEKRRLGKHRKIIEVPRLIVKPIMAGRKR